MLGELFASQRGLGFLLMTAIDLNDVKTILAIAVLISAFAVLCNAALLAIDKRLHRGAAPDMSGKAWTGSPSTRTRVAAPSPGLPRAGRRHLDRPLWRGRGAADRGTAHPHVQRVAHHRAARHGEPARCRPDRARRRAAHRGAAADRPDDAPGDDLGHREHRGLRHRDRRQGHRVRLRRGARLRAREPVAGREAGATGGARALARGHADHAPHQLRAGGAGRDVYRRRPRPRLAVPAAGPRRRPSRPRRPGRLGDPGRSHRGVAPRHQGRRGADRHAPPGVRPEGPRRRIPRDAGHPPSA